MPPLLAHYTAHVSDTRVPRAPRASAQDFVPKRSRAAWNSLEAVTSFGWSGSAAVGGWLIHRYGFQVTFLVTATMQVIG